VARANGAAVAAVERCAMPAKAECRMPNAEWWEE
jgi:hypothetical protein